MNSSNYVENVKRTESDATPEMIARFSNPETIRLIHGAMGLCTEAGELLDMIKKHLFYGKKLDFPNAVEEAGDAMWYIGIISDVLKTTLNEIMTINITKLKTRYPEKFTEYLAENRDLVAERKILEGK